MECTQYVIYDRPKDFPNNYVVRRYTFFPGWVEIGEYLLADSLEEARRFIPQESIPIGRDPTDDPVIVETWI